MEDRFSATSGFLAASKKLDNFPISVIGKMTRLSVEFDAVNLSQGMQDFNPPPQLVEAAVNALRRGPNHYPITWGQPRLREAIAAKAEDYNGIDASADKNVTITCGAAEAIGVAVIALVNPGDQIVLTDPF